MIVIRLELWPKGDESRKRVLGVGEITNVGGTPEVGDYRVRLLKSPEYARTPNVGKPWRSGKVEGFPRTKPYGPWDLLLLALFAALGKERVFRLLGVTKGGTNLNITSDDDASAEVPE